MLGERPKGDRAFNIDPPTSSYAIMPPTAERTVGPARNVVESLTSKPGIREQHRPKADIDGPEIPQCSGVTCAIVWVAAQWVGSVPLDSERFRSDPRTCRAFCGSLRVR
jgi:hypothetical protein